MTVFSGDIFKGTFTGSANIGDSIEYRIKATDNSNQNNVGYSPAAGYNAFNLIDDVVGPSIIHTPISNTPQIRWPIDVSADVTDNIGVGTVECEFKVNGGTVTTFPMLLVSGNTYKGTFTGAAAINDLIEYRIQATDNSSQSNVGYNPSTGFNAFTL